MHGDFSRLTFRPEKRYSAVLAQQGRIQLDADGNEQAAIQEYLRRTLVADLIGAHAGPVNETQDGAARCTAFEVHYRPAEDGTLASLTIGAGRYYVDGLQVDASVPRPGWPVHEHEHEREREHEREHERWTYWTQPDAYREEDDEADRLPEEFPFLVYLKVQERFISAVEDPGIREVALGPALPDTAGRVKVTWQVLPMRPADGFEPPAEPAAHRLRSAFDHWAARQGRTAARMAARAWRPDDAEQDPGIVQPGARYRGPENQLYRIEVHRGGRAAGEPARSATFKWSRDNGSVIFPIADITETWVTLAGLGRDDKLDLHIGDWAEVVDDAYLARAAADPLLQVVEVDLPGRRVRLGGEPRHGVGRSSLRHPYLRRWDQQADQAGGEPRFSHGTPQIIEGRWIDLEDGLQVWFAPDGEYRTGDYWLVPARALPGDVEWPRDLRGTPLLEPPAGISCGYAPLAWITGPDDRPTDLREQFTPLAHPVPRPGD
ncbi:MAG TPA: DUF6519 domain-containing protein [Trebonia sp.]|nr:DUF6519 domain-containing protein [Trebonia sp.]